MASPARKISASIPERLTWFIKQYKETFSLKSDSEVITIALRDLEETYLKLCYANSAAEIKQNPALKEDIDLWDGTIGDGVDPSNSEDW